MQPIPDQLSRLGSGCGSVAPTPEIRGSNLDIGEILSTNCTTEKTNIKEKEAGNGPIFLKPVVTVGRYRLFIACELAISKAEEKPDFLQQSVLSQLPNQRPDQNKNGLLETVFYGTVII